VTFIPVTKKEREEMLAWVGAASIDDLFCDIPDEIRLGSLLNLPEAVPEREVTALMAKIAAQNADPHAVPCFAGGGSYDHFVPAVVQAVISRSEFYTAYTPYQAEISQGTLQTIFEYQTLVCSLTQMDVANASMYDGGSALAEAVIMAAEITGRSTVVCPECVNPLYRQVVKTYTENLGIELVGVGHRDGAADLDELRERTGDATAAVVVQQPNFFGCLEDVDRISAIAQESGGLLIASVDPISLAVLKSPGEYGADIVVGEGQGIGSPVSFGGPLLGLFAAKKEHIRRMPGRVIAETRDRDGKTGYVMALQTREQHIRREKATSNICTNEALCALASCVYLSALGGSGLIDAAETSLERAHTLARAVDSAPRLRLVHERPFFKEFAVQTALAGDEAVQRLFEAGFIVGPALGRWYPELENAFLLCATEKRSAEEVERLAAALERIG
jgi:glycine dehydrogenase subunit 1